MIFGTSMMAKIVHFYFTRDLGREIVGFTVDKQYNSGELFCGLEVFNFEDISRTHPSKDYELFIAIGPSKMNSVREEKFNMAKSMGYTLASFVSKNAVCDSRIGENCFVADFAVVNPFVTLGSNTFVWEYSFLGNDSIVGNNCFISPRSTVSTFSEIKDNCVLGTASVVKTRVVVDTRSLIGAHSYISRDTPAFSVFGEKQSEFLGAISMKIDISE
jgi:acetyltransferase-like isoleucine patch superfamily enzyme